MFNNTAIKGYLVNLKKLCLLSGNLFVKQLFIFNSLK